MNAFSRFVLSIARWIAGPTRSDWVEAMEAEAASIDGDPTRWAIGCLWASVKDRVVRERAFIGAILLMVAGPYLMAMLLLFPEGWAWRQPWLHQHALVEWLFQHSGLLNYLPFTFFLGRIRPGWPAYLAAVICFPLAEFVPLFIFWLKFGGSFLAWFGPGATWYMFSPAVGLTSAFAVCFAGAWLGSNLRRPASTVRFSG